MPKIPEIELTTNSPIVGNSENEWGQKLNTISELTEDKINEILVDLNFLTGTNSVWNVIDYPSYADFPLIGQPITIYFAIAENKRYMWGGNVYIDLNLGAGTVTSVNNRDGDVILTKSDVSLSNVDNTSDQTKANTTTYSALTTTSKTLTGGINEVKSSVDSKAPTTNPTFTGTVALPSTTSIGNVSNTEISYLDGVTSSIQTQLNNKQPSDVDLTAIANLTTNGIIVKTDSGTSNTRSIVVTGEGMSIANGDGIIDNPTITSNATSSNTPSTIVSRNADGNFNAGTITATVNGSASTLTTSRTIGIATGDVTSTGSSFDGSQNNTNEYSIGSNKVTNSKLAQMPSMTIKGNNDVVTSDPKDLTIPEFQTMIQDSTHRMVSDSQITVWNSTTSAIKYYSNQASAIYDNVNINLGDYIQTFGGTSINDRLGSIYIIENTFTDGFTISTGKYANRMIFSEKFYNAVLTGTPTAPTPAIGTHTPQIATTAYVNNMVGGNTMPAISRATNGYVKMANDLIIQWGRGTGESLSVTFPIVFPSECLNVVVSANVNANGTQYSNASKVKTTSTSGATLYVNGPNCYWIAIGY